MYMAYQLIALFVLNGQARIETQTLGSYGDCLAVKYMIEQTPDPARRAVSCMKPGYDI